MTFLAIICLINLDLLLLKIMKEREKCLCLVVLCSLSPRPSPVLDVSRGNSEEADGICCSPHFPAARKDVDVPLVLKLGFFYDIFE